MVTSQLLWREFFYTMSVNNEFFDEMEQNAICISIPWYEIKVRILLMASYTASTHFVHRTNICTMLGSHNLR